MKGILRRINSARRNVSEEIRGNAARGGLFAGGLASEGYAGGYRDALDDVELLLRGIEPGARGRDWWRE